MSDIKEQRYYQDWTQVLVSRLSTSQTWYDLFDGISKVFALNIYQNIYALSQIRNQDEQSRDINIRAANFLGFDYKSDTFSDNEYVTLVTFLNQFNRKYKGTKSFLPFLGFVKGARFDMFQLWAKGVGKDYGEFERFTPNVAKNSKIDGTGTKEYYPTSHVELDYDGEKFNIDIQDMYELFYNLAPAHLVLNRITAMFYADPFTLNMGTSAGTDYYNIHEVAPCIYQYKAPIYLMPVPPVQKARNSSYFEGFIYEGDQSFGFPHFDGFSSAEQVLNYFNFSRFGSATYYPESSNLYAVADQNIPRMCFVRNTHTSLGLRIEEPSANLLIKSTEPVRRTLQLQTGVYTFSCNGKFEIIVNGVTIKQTYNSFYSFVLTENSIVVFQPIELPEIQPWMQLERGTHATSLIVTDAINISSRGYEYLSLDRFPNTNNEFTVFAEFNQVIADCCLLVAYKTSSSFVKLRREGSVIAIYVYVNGTQLEKDYVPYTGKLTFSLKSDKIILNGYVFNFLNNNVPFPTRFFIGSDLQSDIINGYIKKFEYYPVFPEL